MNKNEEKDFQKKKKAEKKAKTFLEKKLFITRYLSQWETANKVNKNYPRLQFHITHGKIRGKTTDLHNKDTNITIGDSGEITGKNTDIGTVDINEIQIPLHETKIQINYSGTA